MILVLGVWTYLRALVGRATAVTLENVALRHQLAILQRTAPRPRLRPRGRISWAALAPAGGTASSGSASHAFGGTGGPASSLFNPRPSLPGTAKASSSTGAGSPGAAQWPAPRSIWSFAR